LVAAVSAAGGALLSIRLITATKAQVGPTHETIRLLTASSPLIERQWLPVLAVILLTTLYFGAALAFLPPRVEAAGLNAGLFFSANGLAILLLKLPSGMFADRGGWRSLMAAGIGFTAMAVIALIPTPSTASLAAAGALSGVGAALASTACLTTLAHRSSPRARGRANAAAGFAQSTAIAVGGLLGAPLVSIGGFGLAMVAALLALLGAFVVVLSDRWRSALVASPTSADPAGPKTGGAG
jgi:MFS family permease